MQESPFVHRIAVNSPTLFPATSTNVFLVAHQGEAVLIDAGYDQPESVQHITDAVESLGNVRLKAILLTHYHPDHSLGAKSLSAYFHSPIWAHVRERKAIEREIFPFKVGKVLHDGEIVHVGGLSLHVLHTPGHTAGHISLWLEEDKILFVGDNAAGQGTVWVGPPDGDLQLYMQSLYRLKALSAERLAPGHGPMIADPEKAIDHLLQRRQQREAQILYLLHQLPQTVEQLVDHIYRDRIHPSVRWAAKRTVEGHLQKLLQEHRISLVSGKEQPQYIAVADA